MSTITGVVVGTIDVVKRAERWVEDELQQRVGIPRGLVRSVCGLAALVSSVVVAAFGIAGTSALWELCPFLEVMSLGSLSVLGLSAVMACVMHLCAANGGRVYEVASCVYQVVIILSSIGAGGLVLPGIMLAFTGLHILN